MLPPPLGELPPPPGELPPPPGVPALGIGGGSSKHTQRHMTSLSFEQAITQPELSTYEQPILLYR